jgi:2-oxoglutarate dehydrogenase E2 component (dihydrolipoamide succinyltransferase)
VPVSIVVPQLGESIAEGTISKWLKKAGDSVRKDEPVVEIMTDKITVEVPAPTEGTIGRITVEEGQTVPVGVEIAVILKAGETAGAPAVGAVAAAPAEKQKTTAVAPAAAPPAMKPSTAPSRTTVAPPPPPPVPPMSPLPASRGGNGHGPGFLSPIVRRLAREHGVDPSRVRGTGRGGRITREDMLAFIESGGAAAAGATPAMPRIGRRAPSGPMEERIAITGVRKVIAERMVKSKFTAVHTTCMEEVDMSAIVRLREQVKDSLRKEQGVRLTYTPFFVKAAVFALQDFPRMNATWQGDDAVVVKRYYNMGVAVGRDEGLLVPVVKNVGDMDLITLARSINDLSERAHANRLQPDDLQGGTFSVTNAGLFGSLTSTPIINYPEVAILGVHKIAPRPTVVDGQIAIRPMTILACTFDHRWIDGHTAVQFLVRVKEVLERPELFWLAV